ncbi:MAG TPA: glycerophosphodiester phosphodiesterase family protein [Leptospiraceae bacterium]|nr:hypothetical protein [Leptospirales bacterium]HMW61048.1 glycerophosphodiester phosphodiesterase family protein [Leptospiraceae bacterium]HMX57847.1 glycerophosphodiester phosphodiesterase family protein [Leptospiraceae bacterium]HMY44339.1 glycerophosphodiester phosphodiesterase family protein [Leptospiraceae bacterium]HMZ35578.1 glycerophosphodiester phosphodiesterase family protein [Leptospiraceae bacterium]
MKKVYYIIFSVFCVWVVFAMIPPEKAHAMPVFDSPHFRIAHRCGQPPEATLYSCGKTVEQGLADFIEMDVHLTKDLRLAVIHDEKLDRTTNGTGPVSGLTMDEISRLDAGYKYTADGVTYPFRGKGINIHPLEDFFKAFPNQRFYVEIKTEDLRAVPIIIGLIRSHHMENKIVIASVYGPPLAMMEELAPEVARCASFRESLGWVILTKIGLGGVFSFHSHALALPPAGGHWIITRRMIESAKRQNVKIHMWTINDPEAMASWKDAGVDAVMTDKIGLLGDVLTRMQK